MTCKLQLSTLQRLAALTLVLAAALGLPASAQTAQPASLPLVAPVFTDHMVLQRDIPDPFWGWTAPGSTVEINEARGNGVGGAVTFTSEARAGSDGKWLLRMPPLPLGDPYTITVTSSAGQTLSFRDVLSGDVWVCTGQSNMQYGIGNVKNSDAEIAEAANYPQIRFFYVPNSSSPTAQNLVQGGPWDVCSPDSAKKDGSWNGITAVGYFFCRDVYRREHVPIGLLSTSVGGTPAEAWTSVEALTRSMPDIAAGIPAMRAAEAAKPAQYVDIPGDLFDTMINPLIPYGVKGYVWYQGESNEGRGFAYQTLLPTLINDWRSRWGQGDTPFLIVQLAGWQGPPKEPGDDATAEVREAQWLTAQHTLGAYMATAVDIGDAQNIHPVNKQETGRRLALVAEREVYNKHAVADYGPTYRSLTISGSKAIVAFDNAGSGFTVSDNKPIAGFAIAGADHKWAWATAKAIGSTVVVTSQSVPSPVAVRYAWAGWLPLNLYGKSSGLPVYPFRTDDWKLQSQP